jgi:hypothetical protein
MDEPRRRTLLALDASINAGLGAVLLFVPGPAIRLLGLPPAEPSFYARVLGAVLLGIALALWIERRDSPGWRGLGLAGALIINTLGAGTVLVWLLAAPPGLPLRGQLVLWVVAVAVLGTGLAELLSLLKRDD